MRTCLPIAVLLGLSLAASAQHQLVVTVRDASGQPVPQLAVTDVHLAEAGQPLAITALQPAGPLHLGLLVDTRPAAAASFEALAAAHGALVEQLLDPAAAPTPAFLLSFDREVDLIEGPDPSATKLRNALDRLTNSAQPQTRQLPAETIDTAAGEAAADESHLYDAIYLAATELLDIAPGRKALLVASAGDDHGSKVSLAEALDAAQQAGLVLYCVRLPGAAALHTPRSHNGLSLPSISMPPLGHPLGGGPAPSTPSQPGAAPPATAPAGTPGNAPAPHGEAHPVAHLRAAEDRSPLERLAQDTGGAYFEVSRKLSLAEIDRRIAVLIAAQYRLNFTEPAGPAGFRSVAVSIPGRQVLAPNGYFATGETNSANSGSKP